LYKNIFILSEISLINTNIGFDKENIAAVDVEINSDDTTMISKKDLNDLSIPSENKTTLKNNEYTIDLQSSVTRNSSSKSETSAEVTNIVPSKKHQRNKLNTNVDNLESEFSI
jgi:hypothetical protein